MKEKKFYIKERFNPQLGVYYVAMGQMSKTAAKKAANALYGTSLIHGFENEAEYQAKLTELRKQGEEVR